LWSFLIIMLLVLPLAFFHFLLIRIIIPVFQCIFNIILLSYKPIILPSILNSDGTEHYSPNGLQNILKSKISITQQYYQSIRHSSHLRAKVYRIALEFYTKYKNLYKECRVTNFVNNPNFSLYILYYLYTTGL